MKCNKTNAAILLSLYFLVPWSLIAIASGVLLFTECEYAYVLVMCILILIYATRRIAVHYMKKLPPPETSA